MEVTALRARVADLEGEKLSLKEKIRKEVQDEYETLVRNLFVTCVQLKVGIKYEGSQEVLNVLLYYLASLLANKGVNYRNSLRDQ